MTVIAIYVDDGLIVTNDKGEVDAIILHLRERFEIQVSDVNRFLGLEVQQLQDGSIHIHQGAYAKKILNRFGMIECKIVSTPMDHNQNLGDFVNDEGDTAYPYREAVGSLMYLATGTRPDISYAVGVVSRYLEKPTSAHVNAVKRILRYVRGTIQMGILYKSDTQLNLVGYSDADYAGDSATRRSTSGYVFSIGCGVISWASMRQQSVSTSSIESEYIAACQAIKELVWSVIEIRFGCKIVYG
ncbi:secreted RxLR effector protein 161-like [Rhagoletis pomonella]|uniref:secreted RxLR effector protein 161-like n=1 Tax=Rhagoletis pomonella TaxID=28610 RepID=UPI00177F438C|nr:secreted RxLR effector protein 161-like [Rhagoletis pomonella]